MYTLFSSKYFSSPKVNQTVALFWRNDNEELNMARGGIGASEFFSCLSCICEMYTYEQSV